MIPLDLIRADTDRRFEEHGVTLLLLQRTVTETNALGETVGVSTVEIPQVVILQSQPNVLVIDAGVELPDGGLHFLAPLDTAITRGSTIKHDGMQFSVREIEPSPPIYGKSMSYICKAERSDA